VSDTAGVGGLRAGVGRGYQTQDAGGRTSDTECRRGAERVPDTRRQVQARGARLTPQRAQGGGRGGTSDTVGRRRRGTSDTERA
jgi:hypothetical protein